MVQSDQLIFIHCKIICLRMLFKSSLTDDTVMYYNLPSKNHGATVLGSQEAANEM